MYNVYGIRCWHRFLKSVLAKNDTPGRNKLKQHKIRRCFSIFPSEFLIKTKQYLIKID